MTPEGKLKADVVEYLNGVIRAPQFYLRLQSGTVRVKGGMMHLCPNGTADIAIFERNSVVLWLELKDPKGTTAKARKQAQDAFAEKVRALGHVYRRIESVGDVEAVLAGKRVA